jgi:biopolymer transport protein ExbD
MARKVETVNAPHINVTPLIDVLLVMLIIFMIAAPLKPHSFAAKLRLSQTTENCLRIQKHW